jgi:L-lactate dehydrogenase complex protein LldE
MFGVRISNAEHLTSNAQRRLSGLQPVPGNVRPMPRTVALLLPCVVDQYWPRVAAAVVRVLTKLDCDVQVPAGQTCCGLPFVDDGNPAAAAALAARVVKLFEPFEFVVTPSYACCGMVRRHYPDLLPDDPAVWTVHGRTYEFVEFLDVVLNLNFSKLRLPRPVRITEQPACAARHVDGGASTSKLLRRMGNVTIAPRDATNPCCGFGGPFADRMPSMSRAIAGDRATRLAGTVVCGEPACGLTLRAACDRTGSTAAVKHSAELVAEALGIDLAG